MDLLDRLLGHDEWTTALLLDRCSELSEAQIDQTFDIDHGSVRALLIHLTRNVEVWTDLMNEVPVRPRPDVPPTVADLKQRYAVAYGDFSSLARAVADSQRENELWIDRLDNPPKSKTYGGAILHVITHNMHHRAHLLLMLSRLGLTDLPEGDLLGWDTHFSRNSAG